MRIATGLVLAALSWAGAAAAQNDYTATMAGRWSGTVSEPGADTPDYRMHVEIVLTRDGAPAGRVRYETLNCAGTWTATGSFSSSWRFREDIADDPGSRCAPEMVVETGPGDDGYGGIDEGSLTVRWTEPGRDAQVATAVLRRDP